jgi:hypothetical protein
MLATVGCSSKDSSTGGDDGGPIATGKMHIRAAVEAPDESTVTVSASLHDGKILGTEYVLTGGDSLRACVVARCSQLEHDSGLPFAGEDYGAELPHFSLIPYTISFSRSVGANAPSSAVTLPIPFSILAPPPNLRVTDGDMVTVQWSPEGAGEDVQLNVNGICEREDGGHPVFAGPRLAKNVVGGSFVVSVDAMVRSIDELYGPVKRCEITLVVSHEHLGTIDAAFAGGSIVGRVSRTVMLDYRSSRP